MRIKKRAVMALFCGIFLTGCSKQTASKEASNSSNKSSQSSKSSVKKTSKASSSSAKAVKLDAAKLTPQESGSLITLYCADRFGGEWSNLLQAGQNGSLTITLHKTSDYEFKQPGSGYAYEAAASGQTGTTYYTLSGSTFYFYQGVKVAGSGSSLGQATKQEMADYIVKKGQLAEFKQLAKKVEIVDKSGQTQRLSEGRSGYFTIPAEMQGTWYSASNYDGETTHSKYVFGQSTIFIQDDKYDTKGTTTTLYTRSNDFKMPLPPTEKQMDQVKGWGLGHLYQQDGLNYMNVMGWYQTAGSGTSFAVHTENIAGNNVQILVCASGARPWVDGIAYRSQAMAEKMQDQHFDDLHYRDDE
ncbi:hypothetical protein [Lactobacillus delbrueckii]|uniref:hypothetical protein n=1 Tax=Lactobacillus delbrueckii TaxID=1584 RepID=UPI0001DC964A|nr:hypothetical protein [Lactobacillus delbrueckii]EFK32058.1 hypothetical protein HMPREF9264_0101 [Lactobacillus delbrueckii subsp. bulgaricus PB2003/044-T3-4]